MNNHNHLTKVSRPNFMRNGWHKLYQLDPIGGSRLGFTWVSGSSWLVDVHRR